MDVAGLGGGGGEGQVGQPLVEQVEANPLTFLLQAQESSQVKVGMPCDSQVVRQVEAKIPSLL